MATACDKNSLLLKEKNDNNNGIEVLNSGKRKDGTSLSIEIFLQGDYYIICCIVCIFFS